MKRKLLFIILAVTILMSALSMSAFAQKQYFSFSVTPGGDVEYSAANPKDDDEQRAYIRTTSNNLIDDDMYWYLVVDAPNFDSNYVSWYYRVTPENCSLIVTQDYNLFEPAGSDLYLRASTERYNCSTAGYWYS